MRRGTWQGVMLAGGWILAVSVAGAQTSGPTVGEILARNREAKGGAALAAVQSLRQTLSVDVQGTTAELVVYSQRPNRLRQELVVAGQTIVLGFDGTVAWTRGALTGAAEVTELSGPRAEALRAQAAFDGVLADTGAPGRRIELIGTALVSGRETYHLRVVDDRQVRHCYLDAETGLETRIIQETAGGRLQQDLSDYRAVDGIRMPHMIRTTIDGRLATVLTVTEVALNVPLEPEVFAPFR